jgi:hypothetical protein
MSTNQTEEAVLAFLRAQPNGAFVESKIYQRIGYPGDFLAAVEALLMAKKVERPRSGVLRLTDDHIDNP